jgi:hypothetical protein
MKIDIHVHTKRTKLGDSESRNINADRFKDIIKATDVKILAITNHNHFDIDQFTQFVKATDGICQIWPGIEIDILEEGNNGHLLVIVNPKNIKKFSTKVFDLLKGKTADRFTIGIDETVKCFDALDSIYIPHYHSKKPNLSELNIERLIEIVANKKRVLKEATNSISAGIYVSHGHRSIYGSDVQNWDDYNRLAKELPDLRLPVESYEQFCLLLEKDDSTIQTILDRKTREKIVLNPFGAAEVIDIDIFNDINILFGSKGTGKTEILKALSKYYNGRGFKTKVYESSATTLDQVYDLKGVEFNVNISDYGINECISEIEAIRNATEKAVTSISKYSRYFATEETNKISRNLKIKNFTPLDESSSRRRLKEIKSTLERTEEFRDYITSNKTIQEVIDSKSLKKLISTLNGIISQIKKDTETRLMDYKSILLFNHLIKIFVAEISKKTGNPEKPVKTGFYEYSSNRINIEKNINTIVNSISKKFDPIINYVGDLGIKGKIYCQTNLQTQDGNLVDGKFNPISKVNKTPQKEVARKLKIISNHVYTNKLFEKITELNTLEGSQTIKSISDLILFNRHFTLNDKVYHPSSGESSMVLLHNELSKDREIYLIDEPEKSLGNDYINDVIVPLLKEHAHRGKKVIIATHDANIAVRTLPYNSIYREHDQDGYNTYVGNPFSNNLVCLNTNKDNLDWKNISMKTLEGGKEAFGERGKIYGNI